MEDVVSLIFAAENVRTLVILVVCICGVVWLNARMDRRFLEQDEKSGERFAEMDKRFVEMDKRFAEMDKRFLEGDKRFLEQDLKFMEQFAAIDRRFLEQEMKFRDALAEQERSIERKQKEALADFHLQLKANDFKHLEDGIDALVYVLGEKGSITPEGQAYVQHVMGRGREAPGGGDLR
jgi:hypothetical protein